MVSFYVHGTPAPGGSKRYVGHSKAGRAILIDMGGKRTKDWRTCVAQAGRIACKKPLTGNLRLDIVFYMPRPKKHFNRLGLREDAPKYHAIRPDTTKLIRSTEDALTGVLWVDDANIVFQTACKLYAMDDQEPGAKITVLRLQDTKGRAA